MVNMRRERRDREKRFKMKIKIERMKRQGKKEEDEEEEANTQEVCSLQGGGMWELRSQVVRNGQAVVRDDGVS